MGFSSRAFLVFLIKESKKRRRKQPGKLMAKSRSQLVNLPGARPLMNPPADIVIMLEMMIQGLCGWRNRQGCIS